MADLDKAAIGQFLVELAQLTAKYHIKIGGCGLVFKGDIRNEYS